MVDLLLSANVGVMVFFTAVIAPIVFKVLPEEWAASYVRAFFPRYFAFLGLTSALAAMSANGTLPQSMLVLCAALSFASVWFLIPRINAARDSGQHSKFRVLHALSVGINFLLIGAFAGLLWTGA